MKFSVPGMSCGHCRAAIEKSVKAADPGAGLSFDPAARTVAIDSARAVETLRAAIADAGYEARAL